MNPTCPNCGKPFSEHRETAYHCDDCGWLTELDGKWHPCPEPSRSIEPKPTEPIQGPISADLTGMVELPDGSGACTGLIECPDKPKVRRYFGGLITVTTEQDEEDNS